jgi:hypothetical protein
MIMKLLGLFVFRWCAVLMSYLVKLAADVVVATQ